MALGWRKDYIRYRNYFLNIAALYKKRRDLRMFLEIILSLTAVLFFSLFALKPTLLTISELLKDIESKEVTVTKLDVKIQNLREAQSAYSLNRDSISLLSSAVPELPAPDEFAQQIEGLATNFPITVLGISVGEVTLLGDKETAKNIVEGQKSLPAETEGLSFTVSATGEYQILINFLDGLQNLRRPVILDSANYMSVEADEGNELVLIVSGRTMYLKQ